VTMLCTVAQLRGQETDFRLANPKISLMQRAGEALAKHARSMMRTGKAKSVLVLAGPGNNGGDAWVAAELLRRGKTKITVLALGEQRVNDPAARQAYDAYTSAGGVVVKAWPKTLNGTLVIDGLFGIGLSKPPSGAFADVIRLCNAAREESRCVVLAVDIPSGLDADSGIARQPAIEADETLTFVAAKIGLYTADGLDCAGKVSVDTLGTASIASNLSLLRREDVLPLVPRRRANSHKGSYGNVGIIGGAEGMAGAAVLAARAALHMGPGKVYLGLFDKDRPPLDLLHPEIMLRDARTLVKDESMTAFAIGMGMAETGVASLMALLSFDKPAVIDADALNAISQNPSIRAAFEAKKADIALPCLPFVFTPHPGEAAQLLSKTSAELQSDRIAAARTIAAAFAVVVVLKGAGSVIAHPDGRAVINTTGNPGMASGGTGDALSGMIAAFLANGLHAWDAAKLGVYLHGAAGDAACNHGMGPHGLTASELIFEARSLLNSGLTDSHEDHEHDP